MGCHAFLHSFLIWQPGLWSQDKCRFTHKGMSPLLHCKYEVSLTSHKRSPVVFAIKDTHYPKFPECIMLSLPFLFHPRLLVFCCLSGPEPGFPTLALLAPGLNNSSQVWVGLCI